MADEIVRKKYYQCHVWSVNLKQDLIYFKRVSLCLHVFCQHSTTLKNIKHPEDFWNLATNYSRHANKYKIYYLFLVIDGMKYYHVTGTSDPSTTLLSHMKKANSTFLASISEQLYRLILSLTYIKTNLIAHIQAQHHSEGRCQRYRGSQYPKREIWFPVHRLCPLQLKTYKFISDPLPYVVITTDSPKCIRYCNKKTLY